MSAKDTVLKEHRFPKSEFEEGPNHSVCGSGPREEVCE